ncbi:MAG TPA: glycosyltransferase family 39 protein, partial [Acidimicrobiales bacterium]|nr:glycosyltransferase family 39 protein [Acidimicrobiales bacterium]
MVMAVATAIVYLPMMSRAFTVDEAMTMVQFVKTPSLLDPFRLQVQANNQPILSFVEHAIYSTTGVSSEVAMRIFPIASAAACVGLLVYVLSRRLGPVPGVAGGVVLMTNLLFVQEAWQARAYSFLCLCTVASTVLMARLERNDSPSLRVGYATMLALGTGAHLYMLVVAGGQFLIAAVHRTLHRRLVLAWVAGVGMGLLVYVRILGTMLRAGEQHEGKFRPEFILSLGRALLGEQIGAVLVVGSLVVVGLLRYGRRWDVWV